jgi:hypothetical protein
VPGLIACTWGAERPIQQHVGGLSFNTKYFFTSQATNSGGISWAIPSLSFTTLQPGLASITNLPASALTTTSATLGGQVLSTGGDLPNVTIFYGPSNGGTTPSAWANNLRLAWRRDSLGRLVSGLTSNQTYFFTAGP